MHVMFLHLGYGALTARQRASSRSIPLHVNVFLYVHHQSQAARGREVDTRQDKVCVHGRSTDGNQRVV